MGVQVLIGTDEYSVTSYSVTEESTPLSGDDSSGSVGSFTFEMNTVRDPYLLQGKDVTITDTARGTVIGFITGVTDNDSELITITGQSRLGRLNVYGVQAQPFRGTLGNAFRYYMGLAKQTTGVVVDPSLESRPVTFQGFHGELWFYLKQMVSAENCEIALVDGDIVLRPVRGHVAEGTHHTAKSRSFGDSNLAERVEVVNYNNRGITNQLVYPPGGWVSGTEIISVGAGETITQTIELEASLSSFTTPVMSDGVVTPGYSATSIYTIIGDDGFQVSSSMWTSRGGRVEFALLPDTKTIEITLTGARGIPSATGEQLTLFSLALPAGDSASSWYSTLRIRGSGVAFETETLSINTGVTASETGTEVGTTVDNIFIGSANKAYDTGVRVATQYSGEGVTLDASATHVGDILPDGTIPPGASAQVFGNVAGARVWDEKTRRWFRVRSGTSDHGIISLASDDDLTYGDRDAYFTGLTYGQRDAIFAGFTYQERGRMGLYGR